MPKVSTRQLDFGQALLNNCPFLRNLGGLSINQFELIRNTVLELERRPIDILEDLATQHNTVCLIHTNAGWGIAVLEWEAVENCEAATAVSKWYHISNSYPTIDEVTDAVSKIKDQN